MSETVMHACSASSSFRVFTKGLGPDGREKKPKLFILKRSGVGGKKGHGEGLTSSMRAFSTPKTGHLKMENA